MESTQNEMKKKINPLKLTLFCVFRFISLTTSILVHW